jgi:hypothetical protein
VVSSGMKFLEISPSPVGLDIKSEKNNENKGKIGKNMIGF